MACLKDVGYVIVYAYKTLNPGKEVYNVERCKVVPFFNGKSSYLLSGGRFDTTRPVPSFG